MPDGYKVSLDNRQFRDFVKKTKDKYPDIVNRRLNEFAVAAGAQATADVKVESPVFFGMLRESFFGRPETVMTGPPPRVASVFSRGQASIYVDSVNKGRPRGGKWPPELPIRRWVDLKIKRGDIDRSSLVKTLFPKRKSRVSDEQLLDAATFVIRRKIGVKGIKARRFVEKAAKITKPKLLRLQTFYMELIKGDIGAFNRA